ncbi:hypothetical protein [Sphingomonas colocasiae]|uniref:SMODS and SLOG-associating 2TM effector domain-containing protein n=1 Tax=Sphingomonas colocasiae TaxID=1848973 RepID=A0ABS7PPK0_9SPHN|nr:hypothetical protein [Sphingomonas colocasiae]MBY8823256.1 hypothetical protein [Sphingomonas colocasiae]
MQEHNRDMFPAADVCELYASLAPLIANPVIDPVFDENEAEAVAAKRIYHRWGRRAVYMVLAGAIYTVAEALVIPEFEWRTLASVVAILLGGAGVGIQLWLISTRVKQRWLLARFAAERLRSLKFQAYPLAIDAPDTAALEQAVDAFSRARLAELRSELNAGEASIDLFTAELGIKGCVPARAVTPGPLADTAMRAYSALRTDYQRRFASAELIKLRERGRFVESMADMLFLFGAILTVVSLLLKILPSVGPAWSAWIDFIAVAAFIFGLAKTILDEATIDETSRRRYEHYVHSLDTTEAALSGDGVDFAENVRRVERIAMDELDQFSRSAIRISYRI